MYIIYDLKNVQMEMTNIMLVCFHDNHSPHHFHDNDFHENDFHDMTNIMCVSMIIALMITFMKMTFMTMTKIMCVSIIIALMIAFITILSGKCEDRNDKYHVCFHDNLSHDHFHENAFLT